MHSNKSEQTAELNTCLMLIEAKLNWGPGKSWATKDFQALSDMIFDETNVMMSVATLKRVWGTIAYSSQPTATTLNALARFAGFASWRGFQQSYAAPDSDKKPIVRRIKRSYNSTIVLFIFGLLIFFLGWISFNKSSNVLPTLNIHEFKFTSTKMVTEGVPNSVIFDFDASAAGKDDSIFIQQSWDNRLRTQVSRTDKNHSSIYYHPGFFKAKLIVRDSVMGEHNIFIRTKGWLPLIDNGQDIPVYFSENEVIRQDGQMYLSEAQIKGMNISMQPRTPSINYYYMNDVPGISCRNFILETRLKNTYKAGAGICQLTSIEIRFEGGAFIIPLSAKGCVSQLQFADCNGPIKDVAGLGVDFSNWVNVKLEVKEGKGQLFINNIPTYHLNFDIKPLAVKGIRFLFEGGGAVDEMVFRKADGEVVFKDSF